MIDKQASYTAADTIPVKLFLNQGVPRLRPVHVQWMPTNACNMQCDFCSCSERNRSLEMPIDEALRVIGDFAQLGCKAVTITGGGEPLMHPYITEMIEAFHEAGILVGLVTNGLLLDRLSQKVIGLLTWCRISNADNRTFSAGYRRILDRVTQVPIDWAFSHVVTSTPNLSEIVRVVKYANKRAFTHVRLVGDLLEPEAVQLGSVREVLQGIDQLVLYQPRKKFVRSGSCLIGYVKPVVAPDFKMYLCCGVQYATDPMNRDFPESLSMGSARELGEVYGNPQPIAVNCVRCYYQNYNAVLRALTSDIQHREFV